MKFSASALLLLSALGSVLARRDLMSKSSKTSGSGATCTDTCPTKAEHDALKTLTDCLNDPAGLSKCSVTPPPPKPTCAEAKARINQLAQSLPDGCTLAFNNDLGKYRLVCTKSNVDEMIMPKMCNPTFVIVGAGGSGGITYGHHIGQSSTRKDGGDCPGFNDGTAEYVQVDDFWTSRIEGHGGGGGAGGVKVINYQGESTEEGAWITKVGTGRPMLNGEDSSFTPLNPAIVSSGINKFDLMAYGGGAGGYFKHFVEQWMNIDIDIDKPDRPLFRCTGEKVCGAARGIARDESTVFPAKGGGSGGGGSSGDWQMWPRDSCKVPSEGFVVMALPTPNATQSEFITGYINDGPYNLQLVGGDNIGGQGNVGGRGDVHIRAPNDEQDVRQFAGGGGGAGGPGDYHQFIMGEDAVLFVPPKFGSAGGIGRNLTNIVGDDLGDDGFFGGGGAAYRGNGGKGGGGGEIGSPGSGFVGAAAPNTGGGGAATGDRDSMEAAVGGSGIIIVTFDACGCVA
eukprot:scaffold103429_cov56-Cyclotella_meneghiniana.AAC.1